MALGQGQGQGQQVLDLVHFLLSKVLILRWSRWKSCAIHAHFRLAWYLVSGHDNPAPFSGLVRLDRLTPPNRGRSALTDFPARPRLLLPPTCPAEALQCNGTGWHIPQGI